MRQNRYKLYATLLTAALVALAVTGTAQASEGDGGIVIKADGLTVNLVFSAPVKAGENEFHLQINDQMGMPVRDASVEVAAAAAQEDGHGEEPAAGSGHSTESMPAEAPASGGHMEGMAEPAAPVHVETSAHNEGQAEGAFISLEVGEEAGEYTGKITLETGGAWILQVHITRAGQVTEVDFPLEAAAGLPKTGILASFIGLNAAVIAAAALLKRKPSQGLNTGDETK